MPSHRLLLATALAAASLHAQQQPQDPANLTGERVSPQSPADTLPINHGAPALQQLLLKLRTRASMMFIVAHPDDEDGGLLTFESRGQGARVAMLTLNRGEGGQNLMSADLNDALGLIRTQELLGEDRYTGTDQLFGTVIDFGFSKTKEEAFAQWTHDRVLYDAVRAVRLYRPLVLASVFLGAPTDGHGHHQIAGEITQEVFLAAGNPNLYPEMGLPPWTPLKVYARVPFSRVSPSGMFDYATGKTIPTRFQNYVTGQVANTEPLPTVLIHEGDPATVSFPGSQPRPTLGMDGLSYVQFARKALALQASQIGANVRLAPPGKSDSGYTLRGTRIGTTACPLSSSAKTVTWADAIKPCPSLLPATLPTEQSIFDGIDTSLPSLALLLPSAPPSIRLSLVDIDNNLAQAQRLFDPAHPELTAPPLHDALRTLDSLLLQVEAFSLPANGKFNLLHELRVKRVQLNNALILALNIRLSGTLAAAPPATVPAPLVPGSAYTVRSTLTLPPSITVKYLTLHLTEGRTSSSTPAPSADYTQPLTWHAKVAPNTPPTQPYFIQSKPTEVFYTLQDPVLRNAPQTPAPLNLFLTASYDGTPLELVATVTEPPATEPTTANPTAAALSPLQPAVIVPPYSAAIFPSTAIISTVPANRFPVPFSVEIRSNVADSSPRVSIQAPTSWKFSEPADFHLTGIGQSQLQALTVMPTGASASRPVQIFTLDPKGSDNTASNLGYKSVGYPGITRTNSYRPASLHIVPVDVATAPHLRVAYLPGTGDTVPDFLPNLGITPTLITPADLTPQKLANYDAILLGVRAYAAQSALAGKGSKPLLDFAAAGGVVVVQYNTTIYGDAEAPYPISTPGDSAHNVVVEAQPLTILEPRNPLLTWPNQLTSADFSHWTEEWGHGFAATWAPQYKPLLEVHDPDQDEQKGGLLLAPVGKGAYIYCALALYRQLPEGVPGAYRLMANLLSYSKNPHR